MTKVKLTLVNVNNHFNVITFEKSRLKVKMYGCAWQTKYVSWLLSLLSMIRKGLRIRCSGLSTVFFAGAKFMLKNFSADIVSLKHSV